MHLKRRSRGYLHLRKNSLKHYLLIFPMVITEGVFIKIGLEIFRGYGMINTRDTTCQGIITKNFSKSDPKTPWQSTLRWCNPIVKAGINANKPQFPKLQTYTLEVIKRGGYSAPTSSNFHTDLSTNSLFQGYDPTHVRPHSTRTCNPLIKSQLLSHWASGPCYLANL